MTKQQQAYYDQLKKDQLIVAAGEEVSAVNAAAQLNKLVQIACGSVYTDKGDVVDFDVSPRLAVVKEIIEETKQKVLIFVPYTHTINLLERYLAKANIMAEVISGDVSVNKRTDIVNRFQNQPTTKVLIIQPQAASHGLTLTAADTIIWYAPITSVETYLQANARIDRPGQKHPMTIVHVKGSSAEQRLYALLRGGVAHHTKIVDLYREELTTP
jgi:SNF2 family DNA or RNA helicase